MKWLQKWSQMKALSAKFKFIEIKSQDKCSFKKRPYITGQQDLKETKLNKSVFVRNEMNLFMFECLES